MKQLLFLFALGWAPAAFAGDTYVLAINGGGQARENYASHLAHLRQVVAVLSQAGIPRDRIMVLASDGSDPAPDLAVRDPDPEAIWLLEGTPQGEILQDLDHFENSVIAEVPLHPATRASVESALAELRRRLTAGDTLLLYVTDHGLENRRNPLNNQIVLWGKEAGLSVRQLGRLLAKFHPKVRIVSLMSQCYSGGFAYLGEARQRGGQPTGNTCGYFSSTPDRPAYGCYPEARGSKPIGHSHQFLTALAEQGEFLAAHRETLLDDETPDIPLRSSDFYFTEALAMNATSPRQATVLFNKWLNEAWATGRFAEEQKLARAIAQRFGLPELPHLSDVDQLLDRLAKLLETTHDHAKIWSDALGDFNRSGLAAFLGAFPAWTPRLELQTLEKLDPFARRKILTRLLAEWVPFLRQNPERLNMARRMLSALDILDAVTYSLEIRMASLWRIRFLYTALAGRFYAEKNPRSPLGMAARAMEKCEEFKLPKTPLTRKGPRPSPQGSLHAISADENEAAAFRPAWLGVTFEGITSSQAKQLNLPQGAVRLTKILPQSPAAKAGLRTGDIITAIENRPLQHPGDFRPHIVSLPIAQPVSITISRRGRTLALLPVLAAMP